VLASSFRHADIVRAVDDLKDDLFAFASRLVRTPSLPGDEGAAHALVKDKLDALGLDTDVVSSTRADIETHPAFCDDGIPVDRRINVVGRWRGGQQTVAGSREGRSLILNGHVDVVPPGDEALWRDSPWSGRIRDGRLYGRGSCDMKAGLTAAIFAVEALQRLGVRLSGDVLLQSVSGEETGGIGTLSTIVSGYRADAAIILEPTSLRLCIVQAGALTFRLRVPGRAAHACLKKQGVSAIEKAAVLLSALDALERDRHRGFESPYYDDPTSVAPISVGTLRGGDWHSTVPDEAVLEGRYGVLPGESIADARRAIDDALRRAAQADGWLCEHPPILEWFEGQFESGATSPESPIVGVLARAHEDLTGTPAVLQGVTYGSDLRLFTNHAGIPAILYGPGRVEDAHTANESIDLAEVTTAAAVLAWTMCQWGGESPS
jgi:acetylornithine deacetylase